MTGLKHTAERRMEALARWIYRNRRKTIVALLLVVAGLGSQLTKVRLDTSTEGFLHEDDQILVDYDAFRAEFGRDERIICAIEPPEVFSLAFLAQLKAFHDDLEASVPHLKEVTSLINARYTHGVEGELLVEDLIEEWPKTDADLAEIKRRAMSGPLYLNNIISEDGKFTALVIETYATPVGDSFDDADAGWDEGSVETTAVAADAPIEFLTEEENGKIISAVNDVIGRHHKPGFEVKLAGTPVLSKYLKASMQKDMPNYLKFVILTIALCLGLLFRRPAGVVLPLVIVILSLVSTAGLMFAFGKAIKLPTTVLPSFLLAVGVGDAVHVLSVFFQRFDSGASKEDAIAYALGHSGFAIIMTTVTTAGGLISFAGAEVAPIADLGLFTTAGVSMALLYTILLLPALLAVLPVKPKPPKAGAKAEGKVDRFLQGMGSVAIGHPGKVLIASFLIIGVSAALCTGTRFSHDLLSWLPPRRDLQKDTTLIDQRLRGTTTLELVIDTKKKNGLYEPSVMNALEKVRGEIEQFTDPPLFVGKTLAFSDIIKEINQALDANNPESYKLPQTRNAIAQEIFVFETSGSDDLTDFADGDYSKTRLTVKAPWLDAINYEKFIKIVEKMAGDGFGELASVHTTGLVPLLGRTISAAMHSTVTSYATAVVIITILMVILIGNIKLGLISMIPNLAPIVFTIAFMSAVDLPMDMFTMLIGSIAIGIVVDDTIHFMSSFQREYGASGDAELAVRKTLAETGRAMLVTSIVLSAGFFVFTLSTMANLNRFGLLTAMTILIALLSDLLLAPALMVWLSRRKLI